MSPCSSLAPGDLTRSNYAQAHQSRSALKKQERSTGRYPAVLPCVYTQVMLPTIIWALPYARGNVLAAVEYQQALRLKPDYQGRASGATILQQQGNEAAAVQQCHFSPFWRR